MGVHNGGHVSVFGTLPGGTCVWFAARSAVAGAPVAQLILAATQELLAIVGPRAFTVQEAARRAARRPHDRLHLVAGLEVQSDLFLLTAGEAELTIRGPRGDRSQPETASLVLLAMKSVL